MWLLVALCVFFIALLDSYRKKSLDMKTNIPGPPIYPFLGNVPQYFNHTPETIFKLLGKHFEEYKGIFRIWIFNHYLVFINDPKEIEPILSSSRNTEKNFMYEMLEPWLKDGLLLSHGRKWFQRRRIITPAFHFSMLEQFVQIFDEQSNILVDKLKPHALDGKVFDMHDYVALAALDAISESALGIKINAQMNADCAYVKTLENITKIMTERITKLRQRTKLNFAIFSFFTKRKHDKLLHVLHSFSQKIIEDRRRILDQQMDIPQSNEDNDFGKKQKLAFLDLLLRASIDGRPLSNDDIREEVDTFTFAGYDTITSEICFTLFLISRHPDIQRKIVEEIREVFGDDKTLPATYKDLQQLKYTELVIKEGLRMYPPAPLIGRKTDQNLKFGDKVLPARSSVSIVTAFTMRNPKYFPDPDKFIPERHSVENCAETLNPFAFIPFSAGPRNCIGQKFAMLEMKSMITKILRHYELIPLGKDVRPVVSIVFRSITGYQMGLKPRVYYCLSNYSLRP